MSPAAPEPADHGSTTRSSVRRPSQLVRSPQALGSGNRKVLVRLPDLTAGKALPVAKPASSPLPKSPVLPDGRRLDPAAESSKPAAAPVQSPHFEQTVVEPSRPTGPQPYALSSQTAVPTWRTSDWKTRLWAIQPTIMLAMVGITAGVLIGWLWTGGRNVSQPPLEPAPAWQPSDKPATTLSPDDSAGASMEELWRNDQRPTMPGEPPAANPASPNSDPYGAPDDIDLQVPNSARAVGAAELEGTIYVEPNPAPSPEWTKFCPVDRMGSLLYSVLM